LAQLHGSARYVIAEDAEHTNTWRFKLGVNLGGEPFTGVYPLKIILNTELLFLFYMIKENGNGIFSD